MCCALFINQRSGDVHKCGVPFDFRTDAMQAGTSSLEEVPDPYYDGRFEYVYDLVTKGCMALLARIRAEQGI
jgi:protein-tyrosine-phosphatase